MKAVEKRFLENPAYVESVHLLLQIHELTAEGKFESDEADAVRDAMEKPWYELNAAEQKRVKILSADLDMLIDDEAFRPVPPEQRSREWLEPKIKAAHSVYDWDALLALLRNGPDYMGSAEIAYYRAAAYSCLGHPDIALLFAEYARRANHQAPVPIHG